MLLTRDKFRNSVFKRDNFKCVICQEQAVDAHHIIERRLFDNGGYYLNNGASLCTKHHIEAEQTILSCEEIREKIGIKNIILPEHLYQDEKYTKWGDIINSNGTRTPGELFYDESVQKILKQGGVLYIYSKYIKYPRTYHLPFSPGITKDDKILKDLSYFENRRIIITEKMDGENSTLYNNYYHARSINVDSHPSRDWIKNFHAKIAYNIPENWRICGENLYAKHSIEYKIPTYFMLFSIWNEKNQCLSWDETIEWSKLLDVQHVPILFDGIFYYPDLVKIENFLNFDRSEGYVIRLADSFHYSQFRKSVAKYVRQNHVKTSHNWKFGKLVKNNLLI